MFGTETGTKNVNRLIGLSIAILAGGKSRRMGHDKARLRFRDGTYWIQAISNVAQSVSDDVLILSGSTRDYGDLINVRGIRIYPDKIPNRGPLSGIDTALSKIRYPKVIFLTCDMPLVTSELLRAVPWMNNVSAYAENTYFPFVLINSHEVRDSVQKQLERGNLALRDWLDSLSLKSFRIPSAHIQAVRNFNTIEDVQSDERFLSPLG